MKIIKKADLVFENGYLLDDDNIVHNKGELVAEVNELADMAELTKFVNENQARILASVEEKVVFTPQRDKAPVLKSGLEVETPLLDADKVDLKARALEFLDVQNVKDIDHHLLRYSALARFMAESTITTNKDGMTGSKFKMDPLLLTDEMVIDTVVAYRDADVQKLIKLIEIDFS